MRRDADVTLTSDDRQHKKTRTSTYVPLDGMVMGDEGREEGREEGRDEGFSWKVPADSSSKGTGELRLRGSGEKLVLLHGTKEIFSGETRESQKIFVVANHDLLCMIHIWVLD